MAGYTYIIIYILIRSVMFRFLPLFVVASLSLGAENIDSTNLPIDSNQVVDMELEEVQVISFQNLDNQYVVEDLLAFDKEDILESDVIAIDENGNEYVGVVYIQYGKAEGIITDEKYQEYNIQLDLKKDGQIQIQSDIEQLLKVEILNFRLIELDVI